MLSSELESKIQRNMKNNLTYRDLMQLCTSLKICSSGKKYVLQDRITAFIHNQNLETLTYVKNQIDALIQSNTCKGKTNNANAIAANRTEYVCDTLKQDILKSALINVESEVPITHRESLVVAQFTPYNSPQTPVQIKPSPGINERVNVVRIPNYLSHLGISKSPFYSCAVCLHPLSLLVPQVYPNIHQNGRITSNFNLQFSVSQHAMDLIKRHKQDNPRVTYKWQVVLRFISVDPTKDLPGPRDSVAQAIPPYLTVGINNKSINLWDILPSNCRTKEGRRHPKPVTITEKLSEASVIQSNYKQTIQLTWWQTPDVFQYFYIGVYLERKYSVIEMISLFTSNRKDCTMSVETTLRMIKSKLGDRNSSMCGDENDEIVMASVLPVSLLCPVGRARINIPVRTTNCQHLQCFDAYLFMSMNERRSQWKCPVCETRATPKELFCDKYFEKILETYKNDENIIDVNVQADGSFVPTKSKNRGDHENENDISKKETDASKSVSADQAMIVLDSDDEDSEIEKYSKKTDKVNEPVPKESYIHKPTSTTKENTIQKQAVAQKDSLNETSRTSSVESNSKSNKDKNKTTNQEISNAARIQKTNESTPNIPNLSKTTNTITTSEKTRTDNVFRDTRSKTPIQNNASSIFSKTTAAKSGIFSTPIGANNNMFSNKPATNSLFSNTSANNKAVSASSTIPTVTQTTSTTTNAWYKVTADSPSSLTRPITESNTIQSQTKESASPVTRLITTLCSSSSQSIFSKPSGIVKAPELGMAIPLTQPSQTDSPDTVSCPIVNDSKQMECDSSSKVLGHRSTIDQRNSKSSSPSEDIDDFIINSKKKALKRNAPAKETGPPSIMPSVTIDLTSDDEESEYPAQAKYSNITYKSQVHKDTHWTPITKTNNYIQNSAHANKLSINVSGKRTMSLSHITPGFKYTNKNGATTNNNSNAAIRPVKRSNILKKPLMGTIDLTSDDEQPPSKKPVMSSDVGTSVKN